MALTAPAELGIFPVEGIPEIQPGDDLGGMIASRFDLLGGDVVVVTQKVISKAEGRVVEVDPTDQSATVRLARQESRRILRVRGQLLITETRHGFVCANAGVDRSNVESHRAVLLPVDPDRSARRLRDRIRACCQVEVAVIVSDTFGRAWRRGVTDVAIGSAGLQPLLDLRGQADGSGRVLAATQVAVADELAGAADLVMRKSRRIPVAVLRGVDPTCLGEGSVARDLIRPYGEDLFR